MKRKSNRKEGGKKKPRDESVEGGETNASPVKSKRSRQPSENESTAG